MVYLHFFKLKKGYIIFISKDKGEIEEFEVVYDKARAEECIKSINNFYDNNLNKDIEPDKCDGGLYGCECCYPDGEK